MQANIIKDVIDKIISINKDLNEESLVNLLIASGWDKSDIDIGRNFFTQVQNTKESKETEYIQAKEVLEYQSSLPIRTEKIEQHLPMTINDSSIPIVYNIYEHALVNIDTEVSDTNKVSKVGKNNMVYIWVNIAVLVILMLILAVYMMSFSW